MSAQFDQIEHMDRTGPVVGPKGGESLLSRIDIIGQVTSGWAAFRQAERHASRRLASNSWSKIGDARKGCRGSIGADRVIAKNCAEIARRQACISNRRRHRGSGAFHRDGRGPGPPGSVIEKDHMGHLASKDILVGGGVRLPRNRLRGRD
jgi:hypothetical protein